MIHYSKLDPLKGRKGNFVTKVFEHQFFENMNNVESLQIPNKILFEFRQFPEQQ